MSAGRANGLNHVRLRSFDSTAYQTWMAMINCIAQSWMGVLSINIGHVVREHLFSSEEINR